MKSVGRAAIGGPFQLVDHNGKACSDLSYLEKFRLVYFGFTYCPDICPTELTKMGLVLDGLGELILRIGDEGARSHITP